MACVWRVRFQRRSNTRANSWFWKFSASGLSSARRDSYQSAKSCQLLGRFRWSQAAGSFHEALGGQGKVVSKRGMRARVTVVVGVKERLNASECVSALYMLLAVPEANIHK